MNSPLCVGLEDVEIVDDFTADLNVAFHDLVTLSSCPVVNSKYQSIFHEAGCSEEYFNAVHGLTRSSLSSCVLAIVALQH